jgi:hypothetical protein
MEMQEIIERLLAGQANAEANREQMLAEIRADRKADADRKAYREDLKSDQAKMIGKMDTSITNIKNARKKTTACQEVTGGQSREDGAKFGRRGDGSAAAGNS